MAAAWPLPKAYSHIVTSKHEEHTLSGIQRLLFRVPVLKLIELTWNLHMQPIAKQRKMRCGLGESGSGVPLKG